MSQDDYEYNNNNNSTNDSKQTPQDDNEVSTILLKFEVSSMGSEDPFVVRVKPKTKWEKVITAFGRQFGVNVNAYRFAYDGATIRWNEKQKVGTTLSGITKADAEEGITIDVMAEAIGGTMN